jgi:predicted DNA-binding transcriptional regulator AlpA
MSYKVLRAIAQETNELIPTPILAEEFKVTRRTLGRWFTDEKLGFPKPIRINQRLYFKRTDIEAWKMGRLHASIGVAA